MAPRYGAPRVHYSSCWQDEPLRLVIVMQDTQDWACVCNACMDPHLCSLVPNGLKTFSTSNTHSLIDCQGNVFSVCPQTFAFLLNKRLHVCQSAHTQLHTFYSSRIVYKRFNEHILYVSGLSVQHHWRQM